MYERSAIVLERYMEEVLEFNKNYNVKKNNENYSNLITQIENYQIMTEKVAAVIQDFENTVRKIESLQQEQEKLYKLNRKLEDDRAQLFNDLGEDAKTLESKLVKIESSLDNNNEKLKEIRAEFIQYLSVFSQKQKIRNKCEKARRIGEANHIEYIKKMKEQFVEIKVEDVVSLKDFINSEKEQVKQEALNIMTKNGKSERVAFNQDVLKKAIHTRIDIAEKEAECYTLVYDKMKKLLAETDGEFVKLNKYKKVLRDTSLKLAFLKATKEYIVGFLDYERMTTISGARVHKKMMVEACNNFELDMIQIKNLYELILKEVSNRASKKAYRELYNRTYLKNIEDKEKNFEEEVNNVNISMGTVINSNYWRIEGIKNIYDVFQKEVSEKCGRDLSELRLEEDEEIEEVEEIQVTEPIEEAEKMEEESNYYQEEDKENNDNNNYYEKYYKEELNERDEKKDEHKEDNDYQEVKYDEEEEYQEEQRVQEESKQEVESEFDDEDSIEALIERSRRKANKAGKANKSGKGKHHKEDDNKGIFNKLFKK